MILSLSHLSHSALSVVDYDTPLRRRPALPPDDLPRDPRQRLPAWADPGKRPWAWIPYDPIPRRDAVWWRSAAQDWARAAAELGTVSSEGADRMLDYAAACRARAEVVGRYERACRLLRHRVPLWLRGPGGHDWRPAAVEGPTCRPPARDVGAPSCALWVREESRFEALFKVRE